MEHIERAQVAELTEEANDRRGHRRACAAEEPWIARRMLCEREDRGGLTAPAAARRAVERLERAIASRAREGDRRDLPRELRACDRIAFLEGVGRARGARRRKPPGEARAAGPHDREEARARAFLIGEASEAARHLEQRAGVGLDLRAALEGLDEERDRLRRADRRGALDATDALVGIGASEKTGGVVGADVRAEVRRAGGRGDRARRALRGGGPPRLRIRGDRERRREREEREPNGAPPHGLGADAGAAGAGAVGEGFGGCA